jgi:hypothetical protein
VGARDRDDSRGVTFERPADPTFLKLREQLFGGEMTAALADRGDAGGTDVLGVVIEIGTDERALLFLALRDGSASVHQSSGGGLVGGGSHAHINAAAKALVAAARDVVDQLPVVVEHPLPRPGRVIISILTPDGVRAGEDDEATLRAGGGVLFPLFLRGNDIASGYRALQSRAPVPGVAPRGEGEGEAAYVMCLLTALARGHEASVSVFEKTALPDPASLTHDVRDLEWFASLRLDLGGLSAAGVVAFFYQRAGFRELPRDQTESRIRVPLQSYEGPTRRTFDFRVTLRVNQGRFGVEVSLLGN